MSEASVLLIEWLVVTRPLSIPTLGLIKNNTANDDRGVIRGCSEFDESPNKSVPFRDSSFLRVQVTFDSGNCSGVLLGSLSL